MVWNDVVFRLCACWGVFIVQWCQKLSWHPIYTWCEMTLFSGFVPAGSIYSIVMSEVKLTPYIHMVWNDVVFRLCACWGVFIVQWCQKLSWHPIYTWCEMTLFSGFVPAGSIYSIVMSEVKLYTHGVKWRCFQVVCLLRSIYSIVVSEVKLKCCYQVVCLLGSIYSTVMSEVKLTLYTWCEMTLFSGCVPAGEYL